MDKLSLIFRNEPQEIQQKLVNLLIRYNALMQYVLLKFIQEQRLRHVLSGSAHPFSKRRAKEKFHEAIFGD